MDGDLVLPGATGVAVVGGVGTGGEFGGGDVVSGFEFGVGHYLVGLDWIGLVWFDLFGEIVRLL